MEDARRDPSIAGFFASGGAKDVQRMGSAFARPAARQALWDSWDLCVVAGGEAPLVSLVPQVPSVEPLLVGAHPTRYHTTRA
jgi:hypothetical protein